MSQTSDILKPVRAMHALPGYFYRDDLHCRGVEISTSNEPWTRSILEPLSSQARKRKPWYLMIVLKSIGGCFLSSQPSFIVFFAVSTKHPGLGFVDWIWYGWYALINFRGFPARLTTELWSTKPWAVFFLLVVIHLIILCTVSLVFFFWLAIARGQY